MNRIKSFLGQFVVDVLSSLICIGIGVWLFFPRRKTVAAVSVQ